MIVAMLVFDFSIPPGNLPYFFVSLAILLFGFWCVGIFLAHFPVVSRLSGLFVNYLELPIGLITGFMFPVSLLPIWAQWLSRLIPISWGFNGLSTSFQTDINMPALWTYWLTTLGISLVYLIGTFYMSKKLQNMIRVTGELSSI